MSHLTLLARLSQCVLWLSAIPNRLRLNDVTRKDYVFRVTVVLHHRCCMGVRHHQLVLRPETICLRDVFYTNSVVATQIPLSWFVGFLPPLFVYDSRHTQRLCLPCDVEDHVFRRRSFSSRFQYDYEWQMHDDEKWSCFAYVINTRLASECEWKQYWCWMKKWNDRCTNLYYLSLFFIGFWQKLTFLVCFKRKHCSFMHF